MRQGDGTRRSLGVALGVLIAAAACTPSADPDLTYTQVDSARLGSTYVAIASSRADTSPDLLGSTLLVDHEGRVARVDNDGMDVVRLAWDGTVLGFSDVRHDYLLGSSRPVRPRAEVPDTSYAAYLVNGSLVSLFNGGFVDGQYDLVSVQAGDRTEITTSAGYLQASAQCDDGVWVALNPDVVDVEVGTSLSISRLVPGGGRTATVDTSPRLLDSVEMACQGSRIIGIAEVFDEQERADETVFVIDTSTGRAQVREVQGEGDLATSSRPVSVDAVALDGDDVVVVSRDAPDDVRTGFELARVDVATGDAKPVAGIVSGSDVVESMVRFDDGILYVLDSTRGEDSLLRAFDVRSGDELARTTMDPIDEEINGPGTSFDDRQVVRDFAVLTPYSQW